mmetsp:Transcript_12439/g.37406  ORF Transcript_12439/g.37406 Transcript_12439/m.37406 type:complete len:338 (-) Transcript_12439:3-1016(-)
MQAAPSQHCRLHSCRRILLRTPFRSGLSALGRRAALPRQADAAATSYRSAQSHRLICSAEARTSQDFAKTFEELSDACEYLKAVPPSEKYNASSDVLEAMKALKESGAIKKWGKIADEGVTRRNVFLGELKKVGIKNPEAVATPSVRDDAAFLYTLVGVTSVLAVLGGFLPGDWGFFVPYLTGAIVLVVLAVGSTAPGLLQVFTDFFKTLFPDFRERVLRHEASHFLIGYLMGVPITGYSLGIGKEHIDFAEAALQNRKLMMRPLTDDEVNRLSIMSMAGVTAEAQTFDEVVGQTQDLMDLQRILRRSENKLGDQVSMLGSARTQKARIFISKLRAD